MRTIEEFNNDLSKKTVKNMGFDLSDYPQRSEQWLKSRLGVITASKAICLLKDGRKAGTKSALWDTYMLELVCEIATGRSSHTPLTTAMEWGNAHENEARELFGFGTNEQTEELTFCYRDDMRCGASPDLIVENLGIGEIKCPFNSSYHLKFLLDNSEIKPEYVAQMQFQMWVLDAELCYYIDYDPRMESMQMKSIEIRKDIDTQKKLEERTAEFILKMDEMLSELDLKFGEQWA